ncbi:MAG: hypothetical protein NTY02_20520, partial [Acidobacteria bacterium]|nr:hypothetical protein [Acidobacteriota bacterium]
VRGDGELPLLKLLGILGTGGRSLGRVPNLAWRGKEGVPLNRTSYAAGSATLTGLGLAGLRFVLNRRLTPRRGICFEDGMFTYVQARGCADNCSACGGGRDAQRRMCGRRGVALKSPASVVRDFAELAAMGIKEIQLPLNPLPSDAYYIALLKLLMKKKLRPVLKIELCGLPSGKLLKWLGRALGWRGVVQATNPEFRKDPGDKMGGDERILRQTISIARERTIAEAYRERLAIENHGPITFDCNVELEFDADYADIFEVRGYSRPARGTLLPIEATADGGLVFGYVGLDGVTVRTHFAFDPAPTLEPTRDDQDGSVVARWTSLLRPGERRQIAWTVHASREPAQSVHALDPDALDPAHAHANWLSESSVIETDHELINQVIRRSLDDLCLLESTDPLGDRFIAAGVPWFMTLFGRDSLITSLQTVSFAPRLAIQSLQILAKRQATAVDAWRDAEPGKILHEFRTGEMSRTGELPFAPYYGSIDSTPLWLILLGETHDWTGDDGLVDANELSDLKTILSNAATLKIP